MSGSAAPDIPGLTFVRPLGSGGYADVYLYEQQSPRMNVADGPAGTKMDWPSEVPQSPSGDHSSR